MPLPITLLTATQILVTPFPQSIWGIVGSFFQGMFLHPELHTVGVGVCAVVTVLAAVGIALLVKKAYERCAPL